MSPVTGIASNARNGDIPVEAESGHLSAALRAKQTYHPDEHQKQKPRRPRP